MYALISTSLNLIRWKSSNKVVVRSIHIQKYLTRYADSVTHECSFIPTETSRVHRKVIKIHNVRI